MKATSYEIFRHGIKLRPDLNKKEWDELEWFSTDEIKKAKKESLKEEIEFLENIIHFFGNNENLSRTISNRIKYLKQRQRCEDDGSNK